jgi:hypothetical protein
MRTSTVLFIFALIASINAQSALLNFTIAFFNGFSPSTPLSSACLESNLTQELESLNYTINPFEDLSDVMLAEEFETEFYTACGWLNASEQLATSLNNFNQNDIFELILESQSIIADAQAVYASIQNGSFNATAFGALLSEFANFSPSSSSTMRLLQSNSGDLSALIPFLQNISELAYGLAQGLSASGYQPECTNITLAIANYSSTLYADWADALENPSYLQDLDPLFSELSSTIQSLYSGCNITGLISILENLSTPKGAQDFAAGIFLNLDTLTTEFESFQNATDDEQYGQDLGAIIQTALGFSL